MTYPTASSATGQFIGQEVSSNAPSTLGKRDDDEKAKDAEKYLKILAQIRLLWEPLVDDAIRFADPQRRSIWDTNLWPGQQTGQSVYDDTPVLAKNTLVDGIVGNMCSRNDRWFGLTLPNKFNFPAVGSMRAWNGKRMDEYPQVARWLQDCEDEMYAAMNESNFYDVISQFISDGAVAGTAHLMVEEEERKDRIVFTVPHFREEFIAVNQHGRVDTDYRVYKLTLRQLADKFGMDRMKEVDKRFERSYKANMYEEKEILHAVFPRSDFNPQMIDKKNKPVESLWIYREGPKLISEDGYDSLPKITWRWWSNSDEWYGRGPAMNALVSIKLVNQQGRTNLIAGQKMAEPPLVAYADQRGQIQKGPNGITFVEGNRGDLRARAPMPLNNGVSQTIPYALEFQKDTREIVKQHFHTDFFMLLSQLARERGTQHMVTQQIYELMGEKAAMLGTRMGMLQSEAFDPIIERVWEIEAKAGRMPFPPEILWHAKVDKPVPHYLGLLAQAQTRLAKLRTLQQGLQLTQMGVQILGPMAGDKLDIDEFMEESYLASGFPVKCLRTDEQIAQIRQARQKQQEQMMKAEMAPKLAKAAAALSKTTEEGSPLKALMGGDEENG